ncbi:glycosyltransferase [Halomonas sp. MCCC 1A11062]|uniref:glycosyltransferase n=1 Tax=Halomonas sp. MCCC 1A11062 TaxID=2733485 RepID=UPI001F1B17AB|nr:glycosyltransferase [Halomonas sp. MCCC 1A11062]MCE8038925.1 glycosyltransferase [Halomonas sp. MCCC 1A11062]
MKIVFFIGDMFQGGAERQIVYLCNGLVAKGHDVTLLTLRRGDAYSSFLSKDVKRHVLDEYSSFGIFFRLVSYLCNNRPDVLVNFLFHATLLGRVAAFFGRVRAVTSHRNTSYSRKSRDFLIRLTEPLDSATLSNVAGADQALRPIFGARSVRVIPNIFLQQSSDPGTKNTFLKATEFRWCYVGRLEQQKNLPALLEAIKILSLDQSLHLDVVGGGRLHSELEEHINCLGLEYCVALHGQLDDTHLVLSQADAFVLPSCWEGMPNALMEAMAAGLPCVATPVGAVPDMLRDGRGILAEGTDPGALAEAMRKAMSLTVEERQEMGCRAKAYIEQECSPEAVIERWERVLLSVVKE